jgi:hypothetical protein
MSLLRQSTSAILCLFSFFGKKWERSELLSCGSDVAFFVVLGVGGEEGESDGNADIVG